MARWMRSLSCRQLVSVLPSQMALSVVVSGPQFVPRSQIAQPCLIEWWNASCSLEAHSSGSLRKRNVEGATMEVEVAEGRV